MVMRLSPNVLVNPLEYKACLIKPVGLIHGEWLDAVTSFNALSKNQAPGLIALHWSLTDLQGLCLLQA